MNFHSLEFLIFLPVVFVLHWVLPHRFRWALLLGAILFGCGFLFGTVRASSARETGDDPVKTYTIPVSAFPISLFRYGIYLESRLS